jgi:outer membrane receptor for ferrienterochelin and colicins
VNLFHSLNLRGGKAAKPRLRQAILAVLSGAWMLSAAAQTSRPADHVRELGELSIKELMELDVNSVYSASRYVQKADRAPASVTVITAEQIRRFGATSLGEILSSVRGLYVADDRNYGYVGIRGFQRPGDYNTRVLVLIDGHRMNDNIFDLASVSRDSMVDVELIERVEIIRGPSSSIYGSSAFLGVINIVTKRGSSLDGSEASVGAGTYDTFKSRFSYGQTFDNGLEWLISASDYRSQGPDQLYVPEFDQRISDDYRAANDGIVNGRDGEDARSFFTSLRYDDFSVSAFLSSRTKEIPTASYDTLFNSGLAETEDNRGYVDFRYDHTFSESLGVQARAFYDNYTYRGRYPYDFAEAGSPLDLWVYKDKTIGNWVGTEFQLTATLPERHTIIAGAEYRSNLREFQVAYYDVEPRVYDLYDDRSSDILGVFVQSESRVTDNVLVTAGVRYDRYSGDLGDTLNPRLGVIVSPSDTGTVKALFGEAFRAPNPYERYYYVEQRNRPMLDPETIRTYELVYEKELLEHYRLTVSGYTYRVRDLITQAATEAGDIYYDNVDSARARGVEIEVDRRLENGILWRASYALQKAIDGQTREDLSSSPHEIAKLNLSLPLGSANLFAGLELQYHGAARTLRGNRADDFLLTNLTLFNRRSGKGLEVSGTIRNVFDVDYGWPGAEDHLQDVIEQNGRTFLGKLSYRF